jgi:hypothetical protein
MWNIPMHASRILLWPVLALCSLPMYGQTPEPPGAELVLTLFKLQFAVHLEA